MSNFADIDRMRLDEEWYQHPKLYSKHVDLLAEAKMGLLEASARLEVIKSETALDIRRNPTKYDAPKITEAVVQEIIPTVTDVQAAHNVWMKRKHDVEVCQAAVKTLEERRRALENFVHLFKMDYFAEPRGDAETRQEMEEKRRVRVRRKIRKHPKRST